MSFKFNVGDLVVYVKGDTELIGKTFKVLKRLSRTSYPGRCLYKCESESGSIANYYEYRFEPVKKKEKLQMELFNE